MKKINVGKDASGAPIEVEFDENDRYILRLEVLRLPREGEPEPKRKGFIETGPLDYGSFIGAQVLVVDLLHSMNEWGRDAASALGFIVPEKKS